MIEWIVYIHKVTGTLSLVIMLVDVVLIYAFRHQLLGRCDSRFKKSVLRFQGSDGNFQVCVAYVRSLRSWYRGRINKSEFRNVRRSAPRAHVLFADGIFISGSFAILLMIVAWIPIVIQELEIIDLGLPSTAKGWHNASRYSWPREALFIYLRFALYSGWPILIGNIVLQAILWIYIASEKRRASINKYVIRRLPKLGYRQR